MASLVATENVEANVGCHCQHLVLLAYLGTTSTSNATEASKLRAYAARHATDPLIFSL